MAHNYDFDTFTVGNKRAGRDEERPRASRQRAERTETVSENRKTVLGGKISFLQIGELVKAATDTQKVGKITSVYDIDCADKAAREFVYSNI